MLAEPRRRQILDLILNRERSVGELVAALGISQPSVSKHLKVLRAAGLVEVRVDEQRRLYRLTPAPLRELDDWLARYRLAWGGSLDDLGRRLDEMAAGEAAAGQVTAGQAAADQAAAGEAAADDETG